jgi:hypothetical protein
MLMRRKKKLKKSREQACLFRVFLYHLLHTTMLVLRLFRFLEIIFIFCPVLRIRQNIIANAI